MPSRRSFLQRSAMFAIATSASVPAFARGGQDDLSISKGIGQQTLAGDPQSTFEQWIGGKFSISLGKTALGTLTLASVESELFPKASSSVHAAAPSRAAAAVRPSGPLVEEVRSTVLEFSRIGGFVPQETYTLDHDWLGTFTLLVVPCASMTHPITYLAIFTRFTGRMVPLS